jgi:hypothetical protein
MTGQQLRRWVSFAKKQKRERSDFLSRKVGEGEGDWSRALILAFFQREKELKRMKNFEAAKTAQDKFNGLS